MHENMKTSMWHTGRSERTCRLPACLYYWSVEPDENAGCQFLPRDATQSAVVRLHVVCLSVMFMHRDHIGWNTSKIISLPNSDKIVM